MSKVFRLRQFSIEQNASAMKLGVDAMLLGAYAGKQVHNKILDAGCGTGIIGLMLAQKFDSANIALVEIDKNAAAEAKSNVHNSPFRERCNVYHSDFISWNPDDTYDLIVSNPPFHLEDKPSPSEERALARSTSLDGLDEWIAKSKSLLHKDGLLQLILPSSLLGDIDDIANSHDLWLTEEFRVLPKPGALANRVILSYTQDPVKTLRKQLHVRDADGNYSEDYKELTKEFYSKAI